MEVYADDDDDVVVVVAVEYAGVNGYVQDVDVDVDASDDEDDVLSVLCPSYGNLLV